jgi:hypothetical protein
MWNKNPGKEQMANAYTEWTKFSTSGITFDYPSIWKVDYHNKHSIIIINSSNPLNAFYISHPIQNNADPSLNIIGVSNSVLSHRPVTTIIEPFKEDVIAG